MRASIMRGTRLLLSPLLLAITATPAMAQEAEIDMAQLGDFIRWSGVVTSLFVLAGAWFLLKLLSGFVNRFSSQFAARRLTMHKVATFAKFFIFIATGMIVIALSFKADSTLLALIGGTAAVAVGFALKDLVASFVAGIMIIVDRPFQVGDRVSFGGFYGDVTAIGLRSVRLQTLDDNTITIPNNKFLSDITSSGNYGALDMQVVVDILIGGGEDFDLAREVLTEAALSSRYIYLPKPIVVLVSQVPMENFVAVRLRLKAYVLDTKHEKAFETDITLRTLRTFREKGIRPPGLSDGHAG